eukprot:3899019-Prymnesium_polylepis.1
MGLLSLLRAMRQLDSQQGADAAALLESSRAAARGVLLRAASAQPPLCWGEEMDDGFVTIPSAGVEALTTELRVAVAAYGERAEAVRVLLVRQAAAEAELAECAYDSSAFGRALGELQAIIDELDLHRYSHVDSHVERLRGRTEATLIARLDGAMHTWAAAFDVPPPLAAPAAPPSAALGVPPSTAAIMLVPTSANSSNARAPEGGGGVPRVPRQTHRLVVQGTRLVLQPPLEVSRATWCAAL